MATAEFLGQNAFVKDELLVLNTIGTAFTDAANTTQVGVTDRYVGYGINSALNTDGPNGETIVDLGPGRVTARLVLRLSGLDTDAANDGLVSIILDGATDKAFTVPLSLWSQQMVNLGVPAASDVSVHDITFDNVRNTGAGPQALRYVRLTVSIVSPSGAAPTITIPEAFITLDY